MTILVVFCPCALVLATPTAIMAAIGNSTKRGILVREGDALERLAKVKHMAFDKTGTLTYGKPELLAVTSVLPGYSNQDLFHLLASAETRSEHPLAKTIVKAYSLVPDMSRGTSSPAPPLTAPSEFSMLPGRGVRAVVNGHTIWQVTPHS